MSRTRPGINQWELIKKWNEYRKWYARWRINGAFYPDAVRGCWPNRKWYAKFRNRSFRAQERTRLASGGEEDDMPIFKRKVKWDVW